MLFFILDRFCFVDLAATAQPVHTIPQATVVL